MIDLNGVNIAGVNQAQLERIKLLFRTPSGTVVFDRDFGIDWSTIDLPLSMAKAKLTVEYINKIKKYEPELRVSAVNFDYDGMNGVLRPKVVLNAIN